jgi:hypothetical protein
MNEPLSRAARYRSARKLVVWGIAYLIAFCKRAAAELLGMRPSSESTDKEIGDETYGPPYDG